MLRWCISLCRLRCKRFKNFFCKLGSVNRFCPWSFLFDWFFNWLDMYNRRCQAVCGIILCYLRCAEGLLLVLFCRFNGRLLLWRLLRRLLWVALPKRALDDRFDGPGVAVLLQRLSRQASRLEKRSMRVLVIDRNRLAAAFDAVILWHPLEKVCVD